jgi:URI fold toxin 2
MQIHGNSLQNKKRHHVYVVFDKEKDDIYKYGISHDPIESDGLSARLRDQLDLFNRIAGWSRFYAEILHDNIQGRLHAREIEQQLIREYKTAHGHRPTGNLMD